MGLFRPKTRTLRSAASSNGTRRASAQAISAPTSPIGDAPEKVYRIKTVGDLLDAYRGRIATQTIWEPLHGPEPQVRHDFGAVNWSRSSSINQEESRSACPLDSNARKDSVGELTPISTRSSTPSYSMRRCSVVDVNVQVRELSALSISR